MIGKEQKSKRLASLPEALEMLENRKNAGELGYEQQLAYDYAKKFSKLDSKKANEMKKELEALELGDKTIASILDVMPIDIMQLKQILANEKKGTGEGVAEKALGIVESYRSKE